MPWGYEGRLPPGQKHPSASCPAGPRHTLLSLCLLRRLTPRPWYVRVLALISLVAHYVDTFKTEINGDNKTRGQVFSFWRTHSLSLWPSLQRSAALLCAAPARIKPYTSSFSWLDRKTRLVRQYLITFEPHCKYLSTQKMGIQAEPCSWWKSSGCQPGPQWGGCSMKAPTTQMLMKARCSQGDSDCREDETSNQDERYKTKTTMPTYQMCYAIGVLLLCYRHPEEFEDPKYIVQHWRESCSSLTQHCPAKRATRIHILYGIVN